MRWILVLALCAGCSFFDDFAGFHLRDGGDSEAGREGASDAATKADGGPVEAGGDGAQTLADAADDADQTPVDCANAAHGTPCGEGLICREAACVESTCGDGFVDLPRGELCEDGNQTSGDGCEPGSCAFSCSGDADCDDGQLCNGAEACREHRCVSGSSAILTGQSCKTAADRSGKCGAGLCIPGSCGNGRIDAGEQCELGSAGCRADCQRD